MVVASAKWASLCVFVVQNAGLMLVMKLSRATGDTPPFSSRVAVLAQELGKLFVCCFLYTLETEGPIQAIKAIRRDVSENSDEWIKLAVPALLYTVQNNALFVGISNLEAAVAHVTYQSKIIFTAIFSVLLLSKKLGRAQWIGLAVLLMGVVLVQGLADKYVAVYFPSATVPLNMGRMLRSAHPKASRQRLGGSVRAQETVASGGNWFVGISAMLLAAVLTSFASVFFEKMLKGARKPSLWLRNIQLAGYSGIIAYASVLSEEDPLRSTEGWLHGFGGFAWTTVVLNVAGGLLVAATIKYADNILRGFAQAIAVIITSIASIFLFNFHITPTFIGGVSLVSLAILLYGDAVPLSSVCPCVVSLSETSEKSSAEARAKSHLIVQQRESDEEVDEEQAHAADTPGR